MKNTNGVVLVEANEGILDLLSFGTTTSAEQLTPESLPYTGLPHVNKDGSNVLLPPPESSTHRPATALFEAVVVMLAISCANGKVHHAAHKDVRCVRVLPLDHDMRITLHL